MPTIAVDGSEWDPDPLLFGVRERCASTSNAGTLRPGCTMDRITRVSPVIYDAAAPRLDSNNSYRRFSARRRDRALAAARARLLPDRLHQGTAVLDLVGHRQQREVDLARRCCCAIFGMGDDGYAWTMPFPTAHWSTAVTEYQRAELPGRRLVAASEVGRRAPLHEDFIKSLTGGDRVNARAPYGRPFNFIPICKFLLLCNERPIIRDLTTSMWRRVRLVPFVETFAIDDTLAPALPRRRPAILNWLVQGCQEWQQDGLCEAPAVVEAATAAVPGRVGLA